MSDLRHKTEQELAQEIASLERHIATLKQKVNNAEQRLKWARHYHYEKTPQELTMEQIERQLGHKVILKV